MALKTRSKSSKKVVNGDWSSSASTGARGTASSATRSYPAAQSGTSRTVPAGLGLVGVLAVLDGAWGGIVPYVGPAFGYRSNGQPSFQWTTEHVLLYLIPGVAGIVAGLMLLGFMRSRFGAAIAGLLAVAAGAWFVLGVVAWPLLYSSPSVFTPTTTQAANFANLLGYNLGPGIVLAVLGGMALGAARRDRVV